MRGIGRINVGNRHTSNSCLVADKLPKLIKSPRKIFASLGSLNRRALPNPLKIFKGDNRRSVFGLRNHLFGDAMICITSKSGFTRSNLLEMSFGIWSTATLKIGFDNIDFDPSFFNSITRENFSCGINCDVLDSKIDTKNINRINRILFRSIDYNSQIESIVLENQIYLSSWLNHLWSVVFANPNRQNKPTFQGKQRYSIKPFPTQNTLVIGHSSINIKSRLDGLISLISLHCLGNGSNGHLSRQAIPFSDRIIDSFLQFNFVGNMHIKSSIGYVIASCVKLMHSLMENFGLLQRSFNLDHKRLHHYIEDIVL